MINMWKIVWSLDKQKVKAGKEKKEKRFLKLTKKRNIYEIQTRQKKREIWNKQKNINMKT